MPQTPPSITIVARATQVPARLQAVRRWTAAPIQVTRGVHFGYFAGYASMALVAALAILHR